MRFHGSAIAVFLAVGVGGANAFAPQIQQLQGPSSHLFSVTAASPSDTSAVEESGQSSSAAMDALTTDIISKLRFRQVQKELELRELDTSGTLTDMKQRLRHIAIDGTTTTTTNGDVTQQETLIIDEDALNSVRDDFMIVPERTIFDCSIISRQFFLFSHSSKTNFGLFLGFPIEGYRIPGSIRS